MRKQTTKPKPEKPSATVKLILELTSTMKMLKLRRVRVEGVELELHESAFAEKPHEQSTEEVRRILSMSEFDGEKCVCGHTEDEHMGPGCCIMGCAPHQCVSQDRDPPLTGDDSAPARDPED